MGGYKLSWVDGGREELDGFGQACRLYPLPPPHGPRCDLCGIHESALTVIVCFVRDCR
jgi:hypothetical protein